MKLIILAAGQGYKLDGFNKILLKDPITKKTILDNYLECFPNYQITVTVGYKAITVMNEYPQLQYIYNKDWRIKGSSYSLALALTEEPCIILPSDLFFDETFTKLVKKTKGDAAFVTNTENRTDHAIHCHSEDNKITKIYTGKSQQNDPELIGAFKITSKDVLRKWKKECIRNDTVPSGENLPYKEFDINAIEKKGTLFEINTPDDFINFIKLRKLG